MTSATPGLHILPRSIPVRAAAAVVLLQSRKVHYYLRLCRIFSYMNQALRGNPRRSGEAALLSRLDSIDVSPNSSFQVDKLDRYIKAGREPAIIDVNCLPTSWTKCQAV